MTFKCGQCETDLCPVCGNMMTKDGKAIQMCTECGFATANCPSCESESANLTCHGCSAPQGMVKRAGLMGGIAGGMIGKGLGKMVGMPGMGLGLMGAGLGHFTQKALERPPTSDINIANDHNTHIEKQANCGHCHDEDGHEIKASLLIIAAKGCPNCGEMMCPFCRSHMPKGQSVCTECGFMGAACGECGHDEVNATCGDCGDGIGLIKRGQWQAAALSALPTIADMYKAKQKTRTPPSHNITVNKTLAPATARAMYDLVQIASGLDNKGFVNEANKIDQLLENVTVNGL